MPTLDDLDWLASDEGEAVCRAMASDEPADTPAAIARWRKRLPAERVTAASAMVTLRRVAADKFTRADAMLLDRVALEQATDEVVAAWKARRFVDCGSVADLCCGIGGDAIALAAQVETIVLDRSAVRVRMAEHNARVYGQQVEGRYGDVALTWPESATFHIDPDRRDDAGRTHQPESSSPPLEVLHEIIAHYQHGAVKLSPGADFDNLGFDAEIEVISHGGVCRQAVAWTGNFQRDFRRATVLPAGDSIAVSSDDALIWPDAAAVRDGDWLYEPDNAVIRAGLVGYLARRHSLAPVDPQIAYLVGPERVDSPFLTAFEVLEVVDFSAKTVRKLLERHGVGRLEIKTRRFAARPEQVFRKLRPKGPQAATLLLTHLADRPSAILARRPGGSALSNSPCNRV
jgi:hypothetical protein